MKWLRHQKIGAFAFLVLPNFSALAQPSLKEQNALLLKQLKEVHQLSPETMTKIEAIFSKSGFIGQGNPAITKHPLTPKECEEKGKKSGISYENQLFEGICGAKYMAPLYNPQTQKPEEAQSCIDQFEFPSIPCAYPVVWVRASEAAEICEAQGKRLCDAHEWEGACQGELLPPDYDFALVKNKDASTALKIMRQNHNKRESARKKWAYGTASKPGICAMASTKSAGCNGGNWKDCGSNTYPAGSFPDCKSALQVYDQHGNAAEHMNLPISPDQLSTDSSKTYGHTEMKGSWFIFDKFKAHEDYCRWRAPYWHGSKVLDSHSHHNYHLGFRCCKSVGNPK